MPHTKCVLCDRRLKVHQRRPVNKHIVKYLRKNFLLESSGADYICGKCSRPAYQCPESGYDKRTTKDNKPENVSASSQTPVHNDQNVQSPPSVRLNIKSVSKGHAYCFICKKPGPKVIVVPGKLRTDVFIEHNIIITSDSRCCPGHLSENFDRFEPESLQKIKTMDHTYLNRSTILELLSKVRNIASKSASKRMSFDNLDSYSDNDLVNMTGLNKEQLLDLFTFVKPHVRNTPARSSFTSLGIFLFKMKSGLSNKLLSTLFGISKASIRRAVHTIRQTLMLEFVPLHLGFPHISREEIINNHTRVLAQSLLAERNDQAILVLDGTYIYINKSNNFHFQRRSYSLHKGRPLVKPMVIVSTTGYYVSVLGPYFADAKNNDASILNHIMNNNTEEIKSWMKPSDIFVVDRGFRDSISLIEDMGLKAEIPAFLKRGEKQMTTEDANTSRLVTKVRWVVEAANARIKRWKYLDHILPTSQIPFIGDFVRIVCAISNKYLPPINATSNTDEDQLMASRMLDRVSKGNELQRYVEDNKLDSRNVSKWFNVEDADINDFPRLDDTTLRLLTLGTYQLKLSTSYIQEYIGEDSDIQMFKENHGLFRVKLQSRHVSSKTYFIWIQYDPDHVIAWYCKCRAGARTVGTCSHVAAVLWYLGKCMHSLRTDTYGVKDWGQYLDDAAKIPESIDSSDSEGSVSEE